jgi:hypothetical protein
LNATTGQALVIVDGKLSLSGGGEILTTGSPNNVIIGSTAGATLTNVDCKIVADGYLGAGQMVLVNQAQGQIQSAVSPHPLLIDTGANMIINAGLISASGSGVTIDSPIDNTGQIQAVGGVFTATQAVTGNGHIFISGGTAIFEAGFNQPVDFAAAGGTLSLWQSVNFSGVIQGYSAGTGDGLDLRDITFGKTTAATFSGTVTYGVLTVSDGVHTARFHLLGAIGGATFVTSTDGHGGTNVSSRPAAASVQALAAAMAGQTGGVGEVIDTGHTAPAGPPSLLAPSGGFWTGCR